MRSTNKYNSSNKKNIIVTGATGYVGGHLVRNLIKKRYAVTVLVRDLEKAKKIKYLKDLNIIHFDIDNHHKKLNIPSNATLIHCAWQDVSNHFEMAHIEKHFFNHYLFLKNIITLGVKKIIVTGTCFEYGLQYGPVSAISNMKPNTPYGLSKHNLHKSLRMLQSDLNFSLIWARLFFIYGDCPNKKNIISLFDQALERNDKEFNMSFGDQLFDFLPVEKVIDYLTVLIKYKDGTFNICKGKPISLRTLLENRMKEKKKIIKLNLGYYDYRKQDSLAMWGEKSFDEQINN
jgi:dTDP-6-deoxy-L-talose 4-dehydrogenase (NAD+)